MAIAGILEIQMMADVARIKSDMDKAQGIVGAAMGNINRSVQATQKLLETLGLTLSAGFFVHLIKQSIDAADHLNDLSKSTGVAVRDLAGLSLLARQTGTDLDGLAKGANKMSVEVGKNPEKFRALGITATDAVGQLKQMADVFNSLTDVNQRNAVAQAVFGKSWQELAPVLSEGSAKIQEAIDKGAELSGITQAMAQASDEFNDKLAELTGTHGVMNTQVQTLLPLMTGVLSTIIDLTGETGKLNEDAFHPLAETLRALVVLAGNVAFVLHGIGMEIGALAAQLAAGGPFTDAGRAIHEMAVKDAEEARQKFDAWEKSVMNTATSLQVVGDTSDALSRKLAEQARQEQESAAARAKAFLNAQNNAQDSQKAYDSLIRRINEQIALDKAQLEKGRELTETEKFEAKAKADLQEIMKKYPGLSQAEVEAKLKEKAASDLLVQVQNSQLALAKEIAAQRQSDKNNDYAQSKAGIDAITDAWAAQLKSVNDTIKAQQDEADAERLVIGLDVSRAEAIEMVTIARLRDEQARTVADGEAYKALQQQIEAHEKLLGLLSDQSAWRKQIDLMNEMADLGKQMWDDLWSGGHNTLQKLGQDIKKFLLDELYKLVVKPWVMNIAANIVGSGAVQGGASALASGAGGIGGSLLGGMFGAGGLSGAMLGGAGWLTGATTLSGSLAAAGSLIGTGSAAGIMSGLAMGAGALLPIVGGIALIASALGAFKHGGPKTESGFGSLTRAGTDPSGATNIAQGIQQSYTQLAQTLGLANTQLKDLTVFYAQDPQGTAQTQLQVAGGSYNRMANGFGFENVGRSDAEFQQAVSLASAQLIVKNLQDNVQGPVGDFLRSIDLTSASLDTLNAALTIAQNVGTLQQALKGLDSVFGNIASASLDSQSALIDQAGGVQNLTTQLAGFYNDFLTDGEKHSLLLNQLTATFQQAGITLPATREEYKALLQAQDNNTESGRSLTTVLLANASAYAQLVPAVQDATDAISTGLSDTMHGLLIDYSKLRIQLMQLQGDPNAAAYQRSLDTIGFTPGEVAQYDENQRLQHQVDVASKTKTLQDQIWQAEGNTNALRQEELAALYALDPALAAMQQHLYDLQDATAANDALMANVDKSRQTLVSSYQDEISTLQQTASAAHQFADSIEQFRQSLLVDSQLSALNPRGRASAAQSNFESIAARALAGDSSAQAQLQGAATAYLQNARNMYGSGTPYTDAFNRVQAVLQQVGAAAMGQATAADQQLAAAQQQLDKLTAIDNNTKTLAQALADYTAAFLAAVNAGLSPSNPLNIQIPGASIGASSGAAAANDGGVVSELRAMRSELRSVRDTIAAGDAMNASATRESGNSVADAAARSAWGDRLHKKSAVR